MLALAVLEALGEAKVNDINVVLGQFGTAEKEVIRFDVTMDDTLLMNFLDSLDHLLSDEAASLQVELALALHEQVFETGAEHVHDHHVELVLLVCLIGADVVQGGHVRFSPQLMNELALPEQHDMLLVFDCAFNLCCID